jgi:AraC family transcriptional regulator
MDVTRRHLFESATLQIAVFAARNVSDACGDVERQARNVVVLPLSGVFSKHDAPGRHVIGTPSHAVFIAADTPYRLGYPGAIGDRALILRFDDAQAPGGRDRGDRGGGGGGEAPASNGLLPAEAMMLRNLLCARLMSGEAREFESEALGLDLLAMSLGAMRRGDASMRRAAAARWLGALERVKEAVATAPADQWTVEKLARIAHLSPFHLCRVFRRMTGASIYGYVLRERLAATLDAVLDGADLTTVALDAGFASHSHFTARFRDFFGCTPAALRRRAKADKVAELRKIATAPGNSIVLD